jgi:hypothetical protein
VPRFIGGNEKRHPFQSPVREVLVIAQVRWLGLIAVLTVHAAGVAATLENRHVQVSIDPAGWLAADAHRA